MNTKRISGFIAALSLAAMFFSSCSDLGDKKKEYIYVFDIQGESTKAIVGDSCIEWENTDQVGFITGTHYGYAKVDADNDPCTIIYYSSNAISAGDYVYSYYPYSTSAASVTAVPITLDAVQYGSSQSAMPLAGLPVKMESALAAKTSSDGAISYYNLGAVINFKIYSSSSSSESETVKSITFEADTPIAGTGTIDLTAIKSTDLSTLEVSGYDTKTVKVYQSATVAAEAEYATAIPMIVAPATAGGTITVTTDQKSYGFTVPSKQYERSTVNTITIDLSHSTSVGEASSAEKLDYSEPFSSGQGLFTINDVTKDDDLSAVWSFSSSYGCMVAKAYDSSAKKYYATESWLISPLLDFTDVSGATLTFDHAYRYTTKTSHMTLWARVEGGEWSQITIPTYPSGSSFTFVSSGSISLDAYAGHNMQFAFKYISTSSVAATWEIQNVSVKKTVSSGDSGSGDSGSGDSGSGDSGSGDSGSGDSGSTTTTSAPGWFEMPVVNDSDKDRIDDNDNTLYYAYHYCAGGEKAPSGGTARNYSVCYSGDHHCPMWVAAPRHSCYVGSASRTDAYQVDPDIPSSIQYSSKSTGGNCNKGHMLGSAERTCSSATNKQVFYYTNIAPQLSSGFNTGGGGWNTLEDFVDGLVCADTLYEVVGCYFEKYTDGYGVTASPTTISFGSRSDVDMPTMFYYALIRTKSGSSGKALKDCSASELQCVAFVRSHSNSLKGQSVTSKELMSISDLEKITGFTYFTNVPNAPKSTYTASDWGL